MNSNNTQFVSLKQRLCGWLVHGFTASGAYIGILALSAIYHHKYLSALWLMCVAILIDAVDGMFARMIDIKVAVPRVDGALLDNIVDFFNYTLVPAFFLLVSNLVPEHWRHISVIAILLSSAYQFAQVDAKTSDHFFKGFPSYWNIVVFYLFFWQMTDWINLIIIFTLSVLSFVPIKYVYPSRMEYLAESHLPRLAMLFATLCWGATTIYLLWLYPKSNPILVFISMGYMILYVVISLYRTWYPIARSSSV